MIHPKHEPLLLLISFKLLPPIHICRHGAPGLDFGFEAFDDFGVGNC